MEITLINERSYSLRLKVNVKICSIKTRGGPEMDVLRQNSS